MVLEIISPDKMLFQGEVDSLQLPGTSGSLGILNNHAPIIATLKAGVVKVQQNGSEKEFEVAGGVVEVIKNKVIVLSE
jgi:F-type H+-transporting ATPase subunit epsilon